MNLDNIIIIYSSYLNGVLYGIPYDMRPGQQPSDLERAQREYVAPPPGTYGSKRIDLDWVYLDPTNQQMQDWLDQQPYLPSYPGEWVRREHE
jgi:hypothetical protein